MAFTLRFATEPTFAAPVLEVPGLGGLSHSPASSLLMPNTRYYWRVTATNPVGAVPAMNGPFTFVTPLAGDADDNGVVNFADITSTLANFGNAP